MYKGKKVSLIIPCHDEAPRIARVLEVVIKSKYADEVIVVDDGSQDNSVDVILEFSPRVKLIRNKQNAGKAEAIFKGANETNADILFLVDADLLKPQTMHLDDSIQKFVDDDLDMLVVPVKPAIFKLDFVFSGQRLILREKALNHLKKCRSSGFGLEMYLNRVARREKWKRGIIFWPDFYDVPETPFKFKKFGFMSGIKKEMRMIRQVFKEGSVIDFFVDTVEAAKKVNRGM